MSATPPWKPSELYIYLLSFKEDYEYSPGAEGDKGQNPLWMYYDSVLQKIYTIQKPVIQEVMKGAPAEWGWIDAAPLPEDVWDWINDDSWLQGGWAQKQYDIIVQDLIRDMAYMKVFGGCGYSLANQLLASTGDSLSLQEAASTDARATTDNWEDAFERGLNDNPPDGTVVIGVLKHQVNVPEQINELYKNHYGVPANWIDGGPNQAGGSYDSAATVPDPSFKGAVQFSKYGACKDFHPCNPGSRITSECLDSWLGDKIYQAFAKALMRTEDADALADAMRDNPFASIDDIMAAYKKNKAPTVAAAATAAAAWSTQDIEFKEQCFLLANIVPLAALRAKSGKVFPYYGENKDNNACVQVQGDPFSMMNALTQSPHKETFFEMPSSALSALQPMIRLYKMTYNKTKKTEHEVEMKFDTHYRKEDLEDYMKPANAIRGHGVGIKSFNFSYEADNPFAIKKSIKAKLVLFANSFSDLLQTRVGDRDDGATENYSYIDLALKTGGDADDMVEAVETINPKEREVLIENLSKLAFRLKACVGWSLPTTTGAVEDWAPTGHTIDNKMLDAIYDSAITLNLTPTVHNFELDDMGRVTFTINYLAYVEDFFDQPNFNIFGDEEVNARRVQRDLTYKKISKECDSESLSDFKDDEKQKIEDDKYQGMRSLMQGLITGKRMIALSGIPMSVLKDYRQDGALSPLDKKYLEQLYDSNGVLKNFGSVVVTGTSLAAADVAAVVEDAQVPPPPADPPPTATTPPTTTTEPPAGKPIETITFFYVSDLIDVILKQIGSTLESLAGDGLSSYKNQWVKAADLAAEADNYQRFLLNFKKMRVLLGPMELVQANEKGKRLKSAFINLGDVPISAKYFIAWMTEKVLKRQAAEWPLPVFLNNLFNGLVRDFLNNDTCFNNRAKQKTRLSQNAITSYHTQPLDTVTFWADQQKSNRMYYEKVGERPIFNVMGERAGPRPTTGQANEINYISYFVGRTQPAELMTGTKSTDHARGLWHYQIGKDTGLTKTIKLSKTDSPGLAEVRFEQEGYDGLKQLRVLYDAKIQTYLDVSAYPGSYIYIEPRGFDPSVDTDLTQFGIGGYYMVVRSAHSLGQGVSETEITAKWVAEIEQQEEARHDSNKKKFNKCYVGKDSRKDGASEPAGFWDSLFGGETAKVEAPPDDGANGSEHKP